MISKVRSTLVDLVGAAVALLAAVLACVGAASLILAGWRLVFGGAPLPPTTTGAVALILALILRFLADLDRYEYVSPPARRRTTTRRTTSRAPSTRRRSS